MLNKIDSVIYNMSLSANGKEQESSAIEIVEQDAHKQQPGGEEVWIFPILSASCHESCD